MTWRDTYRAATFRGAAFFVESADSSHGRRQAVHEAAQRDIPYTEDLGRKSREFGVTGYLLGKDYHLAREELIKACELAGPGVLVHPYRGEMNVICRGLNVSESTAEGGKCLISLTFLEAGEASYPSAKIDTVNAISVKGNQVTETAKTGFLSDFLTTGFPAYVAESAEAGVKEFSELMSSPDFNFTNDIQAASDFFTDVKGIGENAFALIQQPLALANRVTGIVGSIRSAFGSKALGMLMSVFDKYSGDSAGGISAAPSIASITPSRKQQIANTGALKSLIRQTALAEASVSAVVTQVTTVTKVPTGRPASSEVISGNAPSANLQETSTVVTLAPTKYDSHQDAIAARDELTSRIDAESEVTKRDEAYVALTDLRTAVVRAVPNPDQALPKLVEYRLRETTPSLLVAYQVYGDASRAEDLVSRNDPRHPGFMVGGRNIEVLADG